MSIFLPDSSEIKSAEVLGMSPETFRYAEGFVFDNVRFDTGEE